MKHTEYKDQQWRSGVSMDVSTGLGQLMIVFILINLLTVFLINDKLIRSVHNDASEKCPSESRETSSNVCLSKVQIIAVTINRLVNQKKMPTIFDNRLFVSGIFQVEMSTFTVFSFSAVGFAAFLCHV